MVLGIVVFITVLAVEILLPRVNQYVSFVILFLSEGLLARLALKQPGLGVRFLVKFPVCISIECSVTKSAPDFVRIVDPHVRFQMSFLSEGLLTVFTFKVSLP